MAEGGKAIILFGHGARSPEWARPMEGVRDRLLEGRAAGAVQLAFLEFMSPTLAEALDELADKGFTRIDVVPVFLAQGGHVKRDVPELIEGARLRHAGVDIRLAPAVGESEQVMAAIAGYADTVSCSD